MWNDKCKRLFIIAFIFNSKRLEIINFYAALKRKKEVALSALIRNPE